MIRFVAPILLLALAAVGFSTSQAQSLPPRPLATATFAAGFPGSSAGAARIRRETGATFTRVTIGWDAIAPPAVRGKRPAHFIAWNPSARGYNWAGVDRLVRAAVAGGLEPILDIVGAPEWAKRPAQVGAGLPDPADLADFARAAATRFGGSFGSFPRVRYWQVWNEPNTTPYLSPQLVGGKPVAAVRYRAMVNAFAKAVKGVHPDNMVIAGGLGPFRDGTPSVEKQNEDWGPLAFMRALFCLSKDLQPTCNDPVRFDIWTAHPYTSGGPTHHANLPEDVSLGDLPKMKRLLDAAVAAGHIRSRGPLGFWADEFSWDSNPPDPKAVPLKLLERWVPQALYVMWRVGISLVTWFSLRDDNIKTSFYQSGLYFESGKPKPFLQGFRFPLVAFKRNGGIDVWGRTPAGKPGRVRLEVQAKSDGSWHALGVLATDQYGIFRHRYHRSSGESVRGRLVGTSERTLPFSLTPVPDHFYRPFGVL